MGSLLFYQMLIRKSTTNLEKNSPSQEGQLGGLLERTTEEEPCANPHHKEQTALTNAEPKSIAAVIVFADSIDDTGKHKNPNHDKNKSFKYFKKFKHFNNLSNCLL